jgi:hypothetical protein
MDQIAECVVRWRIPPKKVERQLDRYSESCRQNTPLHSIPGGCCVVSLWLAGDLLMLTSNGYSGWRVKLGSDFDGSLSEN